MSKYAIVLEVTSPPKNANQGIAGMTITNHLSETKRVSYSAIKTTMK